jgi:hypothetical protein
MTILISKNCKVNISDDFCFYTKIDSINIAKNLIKIYTKRKKFNKYSFLARNFSKKEFDIDKEVRQPFFECDAEQIIKSDTMIVAGKQYIDLLKGRGCVLIDTEMVLGHPELGYNASLEIITDIYFLSHCSTLVGIAASQIFRMSVGMSDARGILSYVAAMDYSQLGKILQMSAKYHLPVPEKFDHSH